MKKFFKKLLTVLGVLMLILIICAFVGFIYLGQKINSGPKVCSNCILELKFEDNLSEKSVRSNLLSKALDEPEKISLNVTLDLLQYACSDNNIKAISIHGNSYLNHTQVIEITEALSQFKASCDKPIYSYGDYYSQSSYLISTQADTSYLHPMGSVNIIGFRVILSYFSDLLNRWDINLEIYKAGKFKSYTEAYTRTEPSPENIEQYSEILSSLENELIERLVSWKGQDKEYWKNVIDNNIGARAQNVRDEKIIDELIYESEYRKKLLEQFDLEDNGFISLLNYKGKVKFSKKKSNVAYIVMEGMIDVGGDEISSSLLKKELRKIRASDQYKAVILRVNSGGGSSFASDDIWKEIELIKEKGIPVIASIGNIAASGGYYVLMNADKVFAQENSIVGSIGVFIMIPQVNEALKKHIGIDFTQIRTSPYSASPAITTDLSPEMKIKLQKETDFIYDTFITKVAKGRGIDKSRVKDLAQGRVYSGKKAMELGLVDDLKFLSEVKDYVKSTYDLEYIQMDEFPTPSKSLFPMYSDGIKTTLLSYSKNDHFSTKAIIEAEQHILSSLELKPRMEIYGFSIE